MSVQAISWALKARPPSTAAKFLLVALANYADQFGLCWPTAKKLSDDTMLSERSVRTHLGELEASGFIVRTPRWAQDGARLGDEYRLQFEFAEASKMAPANPAGPPAKSAVTPPAGLAGGCTDCTPPLQNLPAHIDEPSLEPSSKNMGDAHARDPSPDPQLVIDAVRPFLSREGAHRLKPADARKRLIPLIAKHGLEAVRDAAVAFYRAPESRRDAGAFQPGLQVLVNDGRLEALILNPQPIVEVLEPAHVLQSPGATRRYANAAEREQAAVAERRASWARVLAECESPDMGSTLKP